MIPHIPIGVFYPGKSFLHRLQARTKLLIVAWMVIFFLIANHRQGHFIPYLVASLLVLSGLLASRIPLRDIWKRIRFILLLVLIGSIIPLFVSYTDPPVLWALGPWNIPSTFLSPIIIMLFIMLFLLLLVRKLPGHYGTIISKRLQRALCAFIVMCLLIIFLFWILGLITTKGLTLGPVIITQEGVWYQVVGFALFGVLYMCSLLLTMTTMPVALIEGMTMLLAPLRRLRLPVNDFALMTLLALRFVPTLFDDAEQLMKAQMARGADITHGTLEERIRSLFTFFVPLIRGTLRRASDLSLALEARGYYNDDQPTTHLHETKLVFMDYCVLAIVLFMTLSSLLF